QILATYHAGLLSHVAMNVTERAEFNIPIDQAEFYTPARAGDLLVDHTSMDGEKHVVKVKTDMDDLNIAQAVARAPRNSKPDAPTNARNSAIATVVIFNIAAIAIVIAVFAYRHRRAAR